ncbi:CRISPR-associated endonuclease Cas2 [Magnetococcales bacterium HHB-1]
MDILVTYDVNTEDKAGRRRLRRVAKTCEDYGQRVQWSVFECCVNAMQLDKLTHALLENIDPETDSLRIYRLKGGRESAVQVYGKDQFIDFDDTLIV